MSSCRLGAVDGLAHHGARGEDVQLAVDGLVEIQRAGHIGQRTEHGPLVLIDLQQRLGPVGRLRGQQVHQRQGEHAASHQQEQPAMRRDVAQQQEQIDLVLFRTFGGWWGGGSHGRIGSLW
ncbi:hypothetical protein QE386_002051 [Pseudoxanthomonas winnipegensis]|nr:hypothetical protein [Pseudoxanthomonas winnipegensis]MDQ1133456.1 hypothetical protein [Pseudoxanthomonas winnipegensis]